MSSSTTELCTHRCNGDTLPFVRLASGPFVGLAARFCYYSIEVTDITLKGFETALAVTHIAGKEGTRRTTGWQWGKGQALAKSRLRWRSPVSRPRAAQSQGLSLLTYLHWHFSCSQLLNQYMNRIQFTPITQLRSYLELLWGTSTALESSLPWTPKIPPRLTPLRSRSKSKRHLCCIIWWWEREQAFLSHSSNIT